MRYYVLALSVACIGAACTASAGEWSRPDSYNLVCNVTGDLGQKHLVFRVKPARFPLIDSTPQLSLVTDTEQAITVQQADATTLRAKMAGPLPGWPVGTSTMAIKLNRNTGEIRVGFYPADWQETSNGTWFRVNPPNGAPKPAGTFEERGNCERAVPIL